MQLIIKRPDNWPKLHKDDLVSFICPSSGLNEGNLIKIKELVGSWGFNVDCNDLENFNDGQIYLAASDEKRFANLQRALKSEAQAIFALRGGYGSGRLARNLISQGVGKEKLLIGFSDLTSLHLVFNVCFGFSSLHAPTLQQIVENRVDENSAEFLFDVLTGSVEQMEYEIKAVNNLARNIKNELKLPKLIGGNLSLIEAAIGTPWGVENAGEFCLLIEEVAEKGYRIDRALDHLINAGCLDKCQAIFIGDVGQDDDVGEALSLFADSVDLAIFRINDIGHSRANRAIALGCCAVVKKDIV